MLKYFAAFEIFFEENLPRLFSHFQTNSLTPDLYLIDWWVNTTEEKSSQADFFLLEIYSKSFRCLTQIRLSVRFIDLKMP